MFTQVSYISRMKRTWGLLFVGMLFFVTSCSGEPAPPPSPSAPRPTSVSKPASTTPTTPPPPASPATIREACPFLPLTEVHQIMGTAQLGQKGGQREAEVKEEDGITRYECQYNGVNGLYLYVVPEKEQSVPSMVTQTKKQCVKPPTMLPGIGDAAWYCEVEGDFMSTVVYKRGHGQIRFALVYLIGETRSDVYKTMAERLAERL